MNNRSSHIRPKKSFGQHFLVDNGALEIISNAAKLEGDEEYLLEIGPGTGNLTHALLNRFPDVPVIALERDQSLIPILRRRFEAKKFEVHEGDAVTFDLNALPDTKGCVVGNLPYNVGTAIFLRFLRSTDRFTRSVFMFQAEVANRITARPSTSAYGSLSVFSQLWGIHQSILTLPPDSFDPPPKVHSGVVLSRFSSTPILGLHTSPEKFEKFVRAGFQHRRKTLVKSLNISGWLRKDIQEALEATEFPLNIRAEALSPQEFAQVWNRLNPIPSCS